ncbi:MAG: DoxX family protein [Flavobacteriales bacterium]|nr:DoxX family protein [Flavobacteriales bacterium]
MKLLLLVSRILVGALFIVSGLIKANDPLGFSYKLAEYFSEDVLGFVWLGDLALPLAVFICIVEIVLGVACLFGAKMKLVSNSLLGMILFFTFLTWFSAYFEKVTDCGCFGDALKLTPWESFSKDVVLTFFISVLFFNRKNIDSNTSEQNKYYLTGAVVFIAVFCLFILNNTWAFPIYFTALLGLFLVLVKMFINNEIEEWIMGALTAVISLYFALFCLNHLPIKDFRPYAVGKSITEQMVVPEGAPIDEYQTIYKIKSKSTGVVSDVDSKVYLSDRLWENKDLEILKGETITNLIKEGYHPPIHDFIISNMQGEDVNDEILNNEEVSFMLVAYQINQSNVGAQKEINELVDKIAASGFDFKGISASLDNNVQEFRHENQSMFPYYSADETTLKTIIRSNPGLVMMRNGRILGKWHYKNLPSMSDIEEIKNKAS